MRKLIDIADEEVEKLKIEAVKQGKSFKSYLEDKILMKELDERINYVFTHENGFNPITSVEDENILNPDLMRIILSETQETRGVTGYIIDCFNMAYGYDEEGYNSEEHKVIEKTTHLISFMKAIVSDFTALIETNQEILSDF